MSIVARNRRLTREDWLAESMQVLAKEGIAAVKVDRLAKRLGCTRGSFYHHFKDRRDLLVSMLEHWIRAWTLDIVDDISGLDLDPKTTVRALIKMIRKRKAAEFDATIRAWALSDPLAADYVRQADEIRLGYAKSLFKAAGFKGLDLENRVRLFLYYEAFEPMMFVRQGSKKEDALIDRRLELLMGT